MAQDGKVLISPVLINLNDEAIASQRNRAFDTEWLRTHIDPDGFHIISQLLLHNDVEWRCTVLVKVRGTMEPVVGYLDVSFKDWTNKVERTDRMIREEMARQEQESVDA